MSFDSDESRGSATPVTVSFRNISHTIIKKTGPPCRRKYTSKLILDDLSGSFYPGDLVALMGASGAGKSTLLNVLSRRITSNDGEIFINGSPAADSPIMRCAAYIQQEDMFYGHITVKEHLNFQARMRIPLSKEACEERVKQTISRFSLTKSANSRIGDVVGGAGRGISGGEKKRLSVATELLTNPSLIFADEPTSGLDAAMAESVVEVLKSLADAGHTVIATIHQPSSEVFEMFNKVLLLAEGKIVFFGPREAVLPYFTRLGRPCPPFTSPAEFIIDMFSIDWDHPDNQLKIIEESSTQWHQNGASFLTLWENELKAKYEEQLAEAGQAKALLELCSDVETNGFKTTPTKEIPFEVPFDANGDPVPVKRWTVVKTLLKRQMLNTARNPQVSRMRVAQSLWTALLSALVYLRLDKSSWYSRAGACFSMTLNAGWFALSVGLGPFILEKPLILRERDSGLFSLPYIFVARVITDLCFSFYVPIIYGTICWWMMGINDVVWRWLVCCAVLLLNATAMTSVGYLISATVPNMGAALALGPVIMLPLMMVGGFTVNLNSIGKFWIWLRYISPFTYAFSAALRCVFLDWTFPASSDASIMPYTTGAEVLKSFNVSTAKSRWVVDFVALGIWLVGGRILGGILFCTINRRKF